jgi:NDP-sugar pyrophosphorylase family protein
VAAGAELLPGSVLVRDVHVGTGARIADSVLWDGVLVGAEARIDGALLGTRVRVGRHAEVGPGACLGEGSLVTDHSRTR